MIKRFLNGIPYYQFEIFQEFKGVLAHAILTRHININDAGTIQNILGIYSPVVSFKKQLHGTHHWFVEKSHLDDCGIIERNGDILITRIPKIPLMIRTADCASVMLFDPVNKVAANIHAGWRGIAKRVIRDSVQKIKDRFGCRSENIFAGISPMLGPCCSRFSNPEKELPKFMHKHISEENFVDLWAAIEGHLRECGLKKEHIENPRVCTYCSPEEFFSFRRDGDSGRFATVISLN